MTTFTDAFKSEIARVARKELKDELSFLRKAGAAQKTEIAALKRDIKDLRSQLKARDKTLRKVLPVPEPLPDTHSVPSKRSGFSAEKLAAHRAVLGLTQAQMARLLAASPLSVYKWESGQVQPRAAQLARIQEVLVLRKRAAAKQLAVLDTAGPV
jgi:DNA-binding XRE family transcriptional regulator